jgi:hypothetical protein
VLPESRTTQRVRSQRQIQCSQQKLAGCRTKPAGEIHTAAHDGPRPLPTSAFVPVPARRRTEGRARARSDTVHGGAAVRTGWCCRARATSLRRAMRRRSTSIQSRYRGTCLHYPILSVSVYRVADHRILIDWKCWGQDVPVAVGRDGTNIRTISAQLCQMSPLIGCLIASGYLLHSRVFRECFRRLHKLHCGAASQKKLEFVEHLFKCSHNSTFLLEQSAWSRNHLAKNIEQS